MSHSFKIGDIAKQTGLTVRTLRHYDDIGLLAPSERSESNQRLYTEADLERLLQIQSMRSLGLSLEEIKESLAKTDFSPADLLQKQLTLVQQRIADEEQLHDRLDGIARFMKMQSKASARDFLAIIKLMQEIENHYTPAERAFLRERARQVGHERMVEVEHTWPSLIAAVKAKMEDGTDPTDPSVIALAKQWKGLVEEFTGRNPDIEAKLRTMYAKKPTMMQQFGGPDPQMMTYIGKAMATLNESRS